MMQTPFRSMLIVLAAAMVAAFGLVACTHATPAGRTSAHPPRPTASSPAAVRSSAATLAAQCQSRTRPGSKPIVFRGSQSGQQYCALLWDSDSIHDCAKSAHGAKMITFLEKHRCGATRRVLATVFVPANGVTLSQINVSSIETSFAGSAQDALGGASQFINLETTPGAGGIDDLSREGHHIPGRRGQVPAHAAPAVLLAGSNIDVIYAWYRNQPTPRDDYVLQLVENDVKFSHLVG